MSVISVRALTEGRSGSQTNDKGIRTSVRKFGVRTNSLADDDTVVRYAVGVPRLYDVHPNDPGMNVESVQCSQDSFSGVYWEVVVNYSSKTPDEQQQAENPLERRSKVEWGKVDYQEAYQQDQDGQAMVNSAQEPFDPPRQRDAKRITLKITRNEPSFNPALALAYQDHVNADVFFGADPGLCKCQGITGSEDYQNNITFWSVVYEFEFRKEGFDEYILDQGFSTLANGVRTLIRDQHGTPVTQPVLLNGAGGLLSAGRTTLSDAIGAGTNFFTVPSSTGFPTTFPFKVRIDNEILSVTNNVANLWSVDRGQDGTTAAGHAMGAAIVLEPVYLLRKPYARAVFSDLNLP